MAHQPRYMLWAWERPEDLRWLPVSVGVAYVATSVHLMGDQVRIRPRANALQVRDDTALTPVVHVDADWRQPPALNDAQRAAVVGQVLAVAARTKRPGAAQVVQLDFEVRRSQRPFWMTVVREVRGQLPPSTALSVTALASWCAGDHWLEPLAADEVVPMAFRMGRDAQALRAQLKQTGHFSKPKCRHAIGTATDEPGVNVSAAVRHYFFSPMPWTAESWRQANPIPTTPP
ncbi:MAG: hypothetical protein EOP38_09725 [Rubrivivax sp.]|nr:MAG: hypothetical protein EOP38_09725 [Rubrivivax sp.]